MPIWMACIPAMPSSAVVIVLLGYVSQYIYHDWVYIVAKGAIFTDTFSEQCFLSVVGAYCFEELELLGVGKSPLMLILFLVVEVSGIFIEWILAQRVVIVAKGVIITDIISEQCILIVAEAYCYGVLELLCAGKSPLMLILFFVVEVEGIIDTSESDIFSEQCFLFVVGAYCFYVGKSPLMLILLVVVDVVGIFVTSEWILQVAVVGITILMQWCSKLSAIFS